jgi:hypothetical protein
MEEPERRDPVTEPRDDRETGQDPAGDWEGYSPETLAAFFDAW